MVLAACGLAQGMDFPGSVAPFILRGITLYGIDSVMAPKALREQAWARLAKDLDLAKLDRMVQEAQGSKAPVQQLADKIAAVFVPVVIGIAVISFLLWLLLGGDNGFAFGFSSLVTVLVIACPCALGLATPTALVAGIGRGAGQGILIKDARSLEVACKVNAVVLDKTGTITHGIILDVRDAAAVRLAESHPHWWQMAGTLR